jgi:hypothetical protein
MSAHKAAAKFNELEMETPTGRPWSAQTVLGCARVDLQSEDNLPENGSRHCKLCKDELAVHKTSRPTRQTSFRTKQCMGPP